MIWFLCLMAIKLHGLFNAKAIFIEEQQWYSGDKEIHTFLKGIRLKVNLIVWLEFELAYFEAAIQQFIHYAVGTSPCWNKCIEYQEDHFEENLCSFMFCWIQFLIHFDKIFWLFYPWNTDIFTLENKLFLYKNIFLKQNKGIILYNNY